MTMLFSKTFSKSALGPCRLNPMTCTSFNMYCLLHLSKSSKWVELDLSPGKRSLVLIMSNTNRQVMATLVTSTLTKMVIMVVAMKNMLWN